MRRKKKEIQKKEIQSQIPEEAEAEILGIPVELVKVDEKTGELCVGEACFMVRVDPERNEIAIEVDPEAPCSPLMTKVAKMFLKQFLENRPKIKIREKRRLNGY